MDAIDVFFKEIEGASKHDIYKAEQRKLFFEALGIADDGRRNIRMTDKEFYEFSKGKKSKSKKDLPKDAKRVVVKTAFEPYHDVTYTYCFDDNTIYEYRFYIGD